jgi:hypothetical protein
MQIGIGLMLAARRPGGDADVSAWLTAVAANGGTVSAGTRAAVAQFVASAKASGYWAKLLRINLFCGNELAAALVPLKVGGGNATDTNVNFVGGDYTEATGLTGNASTKYLRTGIMPSTMLTANSTHIGIYNRSGGTSGAVVGSQDGSGNTTRVWAPLQASTTGFSDQYNAVAGRVSGALGTPFGFVIGSRTAAATHTLYRNGSSVATNATSGGVMTAVELYVFANNGNGTANNFTDGACAAYSIGSGLTAGEVTAYNTHMQTFQTALSRNV